MVNHLKGANKMTNEQTHMFLEMIIELIEESATKEEVIQKIKRVQQIKKTQ